LSALAVVAESSEVARSAGQGLSLALSLALKDSASAVEPVRRGRMGRVAQVGRVPTMLARSMIRTSG